MYRILYWTVRLKSLVLAFIIQISIFYKAGKLKNVYQDENIYLVPLKIFSNITFCLKAIERVKESKFGSELVLRRFGFVCFKASEERIICLFLCAANTLELYH